MCFLTYERDKASNWTAERFNTSFLFTPRYLPLWSHSCCGVESSAIQGAFISSGWGQYLVWSRPFFICTKRSPFLTHSTLMAPFTPLSAPSPGSTMTASLSPRFAHADLSAGKLVVHREPFVTNLQGGGMARSFKLYLTIFSPSHTGYFSLSHFSDVTKVIHCLCHWMPHSFLHKYSPAVGCICKSLSAAEWLWWQSQHASSRSSKSLFLSFHISFYKCLLCVDVILQASVLQSMWQ